MFWRAQETLSTVGWILRALFAYVWLLIIARAMGRRQIGELSIIDQIVGITIGSIFASTLSNPKIPFMNPVKTTATIAILHIVITYLALRSRALRGAIVSGPLILVENGRVIEENLRQARTNLDNLMTELRLKDHPSLHDVEFAILESNGKLSVIPKSQARPVMPADLGLPAKYEGLPIILIKDGHIQSDQLKENDLSESWLWEELRRKGVRDVSEVFIALLDTQGRLFVDTKEPPDAPTMAP